MIDKLNPDVAPLAGLLQPKPGIGRGRHSKLYWWLFTHADEVRLVLEQGRPLWTDVAAHLPDTDDVLDGAGKRPTGDRVRKTWIEVCQAKGWSAKPTTESPQSSATKDQPVAPDPLGDDDDDVLLTAGDGTVLKPPS